MTESLLISSYNSPCGALMLGALGEELVLCDWADGWHRQATENRMKRLLKAPVLEGTSPVIERAAVSWAVEAVSAEEIDAMNILAASICGMQRAVRRLSVRPDLLLVDGNRFKPFDGYRYLTVVHGDATFASIAAASVLAKTYRDDFMTALAAEWPQYGWDRNMGYPTADHIRAIREYGYTPWHRKSFHVKELEATLFDSLPDD